MQSEWWYQSVTGRNKTPAKGVVLKNHLHNAVARIVIGLALVLPYRVRVGFVGWFMAKFVAPFAGWKARVRNNFAQILPDVPPAEVERIADSVCNNVGRTLIEIYSGEEFVGRIKETPLVGPGVAAFEAARAEGKPMVLATAHIGNYDVVRGKLSQEGMEIGALYKPIRNKAFNRHYADAISKIGAPVFAVGRAGVAGLVRHLKQGGSIGIVADVANINAPLLSFFGHPAHTPVSAAEWAVKYDAVLLPIFGLREPDGLSFKIYVAEPIDHGEPAEMMQRYNDVVEAIARENIEQWFWIHRRWKQLETGPA